MGRGWAGRGWGAVARGRAGLGLAGLGWAWLGWAWLGLAGLEGGGGAGRGAAGLGGAGGGERGGAACSDESVTGVARVALDQSRNKPVNLILLLFPLAKFVSMKQRRSFAGINSPLSPCC